MRNLKDLPVQKLYPYQQGHQIIVKCGSRGHQLAVVIEDCGKKYAFSSAKWDYVRVRKWNATRKKWTGTVRVAREYILGRVIGSALHSSVALYKEGKRP